MESRKEMRFHKEREKNRRAEIRKKSGQEQNHLRQKGARETKKSGTQAN